MRNNKFIKTVNANRVKWNRHALERMMERNISIQVVKDVLLNGEIIENYDEQKPYPGALFFGLLNKKPYHVVAAHDGETNIIFIITVYIPDLKHFEKDFKTRKK